MLLRKYYKDSQKVLLESALNVKNLTRAQNSNERIIKEHPKAIGTSDNTSYTRLLV